MFAMFFVCTLIGAVICTALFVIFYLNDNCHMSRLVKEYNAWQYQNYGNISKHLNLSELIHTIGTDRLKHCYGVKVSILEPNVQFHVARLPVYEINVDDHQNIQLSYKKIIKRNKLNYPIVER